MEEQDICLDFLPKLPEYILRRAYLAINYADVCAFSQINLRPMQASAIVIIHRNPGLTQTQVGKALRIHRSNFVPILNALEHKGLVKRTPSVNDQRAQSLFLTPKGMEAMAEIQKLSEEHMRMFLEKFGEEKWAGLVDLLNKLINDLTDSFGDFDKDERYSNNTLQ
jgi:DNA-binding MarR family transcriptional regulator